MAGIRGKDTRPEILVRKGLHRRGLRYRLGGHNLPGRPDLTFPRKRAAVFVHGCYWHRHEGCRYATMPSTRTDFWEAKFRENVVRDRRVSEELDREGWSVYVVWECETRDPVEREVMLDRLAEALRRTERVRERDKSFTRAHEPHE